GDDVQVSAIGSDAIQKNRTLPGLAAADLEISKSKGIRAHRASTRIVASRWRTLWHYTGGESHQCQRIASVQWRFGDKSAFDYLPQRLRLGLKQWRLCLNFYGLTQSADLQRNIDAEATFDLDHDWIAGKFLETALLPFY